MVQTRVSPVEVHADETLRIGLFSESFQPVQNGVTTSVLTLVAGLRARGNHVCIFAPAHQQQRETEMNVLRFPAYVSVFNREYPVALPFIPRLALATHFHRLRLDIVHTHTPFVLGLTGANLALSRKVPLVSTFHTLYSQYTHYIPLIPDTVTLGLLNHYLPWYYNRCDEIICPSHVAARALRKQGVERPITVIPTGIPLPSPDSISLDARRTARAQIGVDADAPLLLYAGRLSPEKHIDWLMEVFAQIRHDIPEARLAIAGGGTQDADLKQIADTLQLGESVLFLGPIPRRNMDPLFAAADVFCFPSPSETQGLVIGEARAAGTPSVVVDAGGAPETVKDGEDGFCVPPDDKAAFVSCVARILQDRDLRERLRTNALRNAHHFTPETMVSRVLEVYERARHQSEAPRKLTAGEVQEELQWEAVGQSIYENPGPATRQ